MIKILLIAIVFYCNFSYANSPKSILTKIGLKTLNSCRVVESTNELKDLQNVNVDFFPSLVLKGLLTVIFKHPKNPYSYTYEVTRVETQSNKAFMQAVMRGDTNERDQEIRLELSPAAANSQFLKINSASLIQYMSGSPSNYQSKAVFNCK